MRGYALFEYSRKLTKFRALICVFYDMSYGKAIISPHFPPSILAFLCNTYSKGEVNIVTPSLDFYLIRPIQFYVCYQCVAMGPLFPLIQKSTINLPMRSLWRYSVSAPSKFCRYSQCTQKIDKKLFLAKTRRNIRFSREFWQNN